MAEANEWLDKAMKTVELVSVRLLSDGIFIEFADGQGGFFPSSFLQAHKDCTPNHLFVRLDHPDGAGESTMPYGHLESAELRLSAEQFGLGLIHS